MKRIFISLISSLFILPVIIFFNSIIVIFSSSELGRRSIFFDTFYFKSTMSDTGSTIVAFGWSGNVTVLFFAFAFIALLMYCFIRIFDKQHDV